MKKGVTLLCTCLFVIGLNLRGGENKNAKRAEKCRYHAHQLRG